MIPENIRNNFTVRTWKYGIPAARKWVAKVYPGRKFARETVKD